MTINGREYKTPDLNDFDTVIRLEENGINLLGLMGDIQNKFNSAPLTTIRDMTSILTGMTKEESLSEIKEFVSGGGTLTDYMEIIAVGIEELVASGEKAGFTKAAKTPQDHKTKAAPKRQEQ
jgi:hypothetical protein